MLTEHFSQKEFDCKCGCGEGDIDMHLVTLLQNVRTQYRKPIKITSGLRCPTHNQAIGGKPHSAHLYGFAVDIACSSSTDRRILLKHLIPRFNRIGIGSDFIHVDVDATKPQSVIWVYN